MRLVTTMAFAMVAGAVAAAACSAGDGSNQEGGGAGGNGSGNSGTGAGNTNIGGFSTGGQTGTGGDEVCQAIAEEATPKLQPADIIFAVDTSGSMGEESSFVRDRINDFSKQISLTGIDVRVFMLAEALLFPCIGPACPPGICVDAPLGSGSCPNDHNPPHYFHPSGTDVYSTDSLSVIIDSWPSWGNVVREDATKYLIIISDDNAAAPYIDDAQTFIDTFTALAPSKLSGFTAHGIYCFSDQGDCVVKGQVYEDLVNLTGGIHGDLALQDFQPIFDAVAEQVVIAAAELPCQWDLPDPPEGEELDPALVNVLFTAGDASETDIYKVAGESDCDPDSGGWYYDNEANPATIHLCAASCDLVSGDPQGRIDILFGCSTKLPPPD